MVAACLEWFLWIAAFLYCLWKVFCKAEHWTVNVLAVIVGVAFTLLRLIFLPIMLVTLPLPSAVVRMWPADMVLVLQWFAFWSFAGLLTIPWLFCVYQIVTHQLGRTKRIKQVLDELSAPKVVVVMPCYREDPEVLVTAINSVVDCDYPPSCIHVFLSFDGDQEDELYLNTLEKLGVPLTLDSYPKSIDVTYRAARVTISRFPHGGKRHCQKLTFKLIDRVYQQYLKRNDNLFILFIDSDCILDRVCLQNFVYDMELSPKNRHDMLAMTGVITSTTRRHSLITLLQDMKYVHGQLFERTVESGCGAVTCLPGALTMLRFSAFRRMAKYYFADKAEQCEDLFDFAKCHLGEDRWLTHLFMIGAKKRYQIQMCTSAFCKTEAVQTVRSLVKQRRRWFLGFVTNEVCMLTDWRLWKRYPILVLVRFMQNTIRTTALLFFIMVLALLTTSKRVSNLPVGFIAVSLGLNWIMMIYFGFKLRRFKIWLYPLMFVLNPFLNWYYMVYGIFTAGQRTWGGPRADAAAADGDKTTVQDAIEQAEKAGDELNIVPESFVPAAKVQRRKSSKRRPSVRGAKKPSLDLAVTTAGRVLGDPMREGFSDADTGEDTGHSSGVSAGGLRFSTTVGRSKSGRSLLQPPDKVDGMFSAPERTDSGLYHYSDDSVGSFNMSRVAGGGSGDDLAGSPPRTIGGTGTDGHYGWNARNGKQALYVRDSFESFVSSQTAGHNPVYLPRRVESLMSYEDRRKYEMAQAGQLSVGATVATAASSAAVHHLAKYRNPSQQQPGPNALRLITPPPGPVYEYHSEAEMQQGEFLAGMDPIRTATQAGSREMDRGGEGLYSIAPAQPASSVSTPPTTSPPNQPRQPSGLSPPGGTGAGRSFLGRMSYVHASTSDEGTTDETPRRSGREEKPGRSK
ncbi:chitin synthase d [Grosmannia clavigera kw1407]|uniref:chitin synthase n=1 Tax=Grosmannia clavigera (strain kw1407 / UAMH 11150) TaxID=655863 RepID=F0X8Y9_GROCL|nr:chitin synthase d [Grosmannia clavigera kw1407]EFX05839.1 chitin synthase d [Grosmannia clavigera kw1407]